MHREDSEMTDEIQESNVIEESDFENEFNKLANQKNEGEPEEVEIKDEPELPEIEAADVSDEPDPTPEPDIYTGMSDEAKAHFAQIEQENTKLNHRINSDDGRVRAYQKQAQDLQERLKKSEEVKIDEPKIPVKSENWNKFGEEYPEIAEEQDAQNAANTEAVKQMVDNALAPIKEQYEQTQQREFEAQDVVAKNEVSNEFQKWDEFIGSDAGKIEFGNWMAEQPPGIQDLAQSALPSDAIAMIGLYDSASVANGKPSLRNTTPDTGVDTQQQVEAEKLKAKRKRQLNDGVTVPSKGAKVNPGNETIDDFDVAFNHFAGKKERQRA